MQLPDIVQELATWCHMQAVDCQLAGHDEFANRFLQIEKLLQLIPAYIHIDEQSKVVISKYQVAVAEMEAEIRRLQTNQRY